MDVFTDPFVHTTVIMSSAQVGKTEIINNCIGYAIDRDPGPMLFTMPSEDAARDLSKDRLAPMFRGTPCLTDKVREARAKDSSNTILHKSFPGGQLVLSGANSPTPLSSRPIRYLFPDEVDKYPQSAGKEGDPISLAIKRTRTYWNRKILLTSTPSIAGESRIEKAYEESDKRRFHIPCPHCGAFQHLTWDHVMWDKGEDGQHLFDTAYYACVNGCVITEGQKIRALQKGKWIAEQPFAGIAGFHLNEIYSPWSSMAEMAADFVSAKRKGAKALQVFTNASLGLTWEEQGETIDDNALYGRRERFPEKLVREIGYITAGVDVQENRLEVEFVAWGEGYESWSIDHRVIYGDTLQKGVWDELDILLLRQWEHVSGAMLKASCTFIDSGYRSEMVYNFVKPRLTRRVYAIKGSNTIDAPQIRRSKTSRKSKAKAKGVELVHIGVHSLKDDVFSFMALIEPGPGYMHTPLDRPLDYFKQLTAEKKVTKYHNRKKVKVYVLRSGRRNEALDLRVYAYAALLYANPDLKAFVEHINNVDPDEPAPPVRKRGPRGKGVF